MDFILTDISSASAGSPIITVAGDDVVANNNIAYLLGGTMGAVVIGQDFWLFDNAHKVLSPSETVFEEQENKFNDIPPLLLEQYRGRFIASKDGRIVDSDVDFVTLVHRFFETFGDVPVYMTKIGGDDYVMIDTPFFD